MQPSVYFVLFARTCILDSAFLTIGTDETSLKTSRLVVNLHRVNPAKLQAAVIVS
jgi:hypothetical protein